MNRLHWFTRFGFVAILLGLVSVTSAQENVDKLITVRAGALPIILSAPHGGRKAPPNVAERKGNGIAQFTTTRDENTAELTEKIAAALEKRMNGKPYVVIARFERKYIDANRAAKSAYESDAARPYYDAYHAALKKAHADVQSHWRSGLVVDVHGQAGDADAIFRGTANGATTKHLTERHGKAALTGPKSILGVLAKHGIPIIPRNESKDNEDKRYNGGYTVRTYGSSDGGTIDAIQLEIGTKLRQTKSLDKIANEIADAISVFAKEYLPAERLKKN